MSELEIDGTAARRSVWSVLRALWSHLRTRRRRQFALLSVLMVITSFAEVATLGSLMPFLGALTAPDVVWENALVKRAAGWVGITSADELLLPLTVLFITTGVATAGLRILQSYAQHMFASATANDISTSVYRRTLYQPYSVHLNRNTASAIAGISKVDHIAGAVLSPIPRLLGSVLMLLFIGSALVFINPLMAAIAGIGFGIGYWVISRRVRERLQANSVEHARATTVVVKAQQEGLGGIRDVLLDGTQDYFSTLYSEADWPKRRAVAVNSYMNAAPRFLMEALGMGLIAVLAYVISLQEGGVALAIPMLGALALGAQRLLPALQEIYSSWAMFTGSQAVLADVLELLDQPLPEYASGPPIEPLGLRSSVRLDDVWFRYSSDQPWAVESLDFAIPKGARVGFVGSTGGGKSTALDLTMGLLPPTRGRLLVDGDFVEGDSVRAWQRSISHVPQHIFLADASFAENIAFGVDPKHIDREQVKIAAQRAQLARFIEERRDGYDARIGERGVRLSGGQRQRLGIARALYKQSSVLVFDEATSALDNTTEQAVMAAIDDLDDELTIIIVAHRLTTVEDCDLIIQLEAARVVATGTYQELLETSPSFRAMAESRP